MFLGQVCGTVVADHKLAELEGASFRIVLPVDEAGQPTGAHLVAVDNIASRHGDLVYLVKGKEAIIPWKKTDLAPIDAAIVGLVDGMEKA
ncbi:MAG: EutN/CcmL family microcompartment protein [Vulcanimicrobiota bacterium]